MANGKRTVWVPLDEDLAAELQARLGPVSSAVNDVVRTELSRRRGLSAGLEIR
jgi:hypothetical protein